MTQSTRIQRVHILDVDGIILFIPPIHFENHVPVTSVAMARAVAGNVESIVRVTRLQIGQFKRQMLPHFGRHSPCIEEDF